MTHSLASSIWSSFALCLRNTIWKSYYIKLSFSLILYQALIVPFEIKLVCLSSSWNLEKLTPCWSSSCWDFWNIWALNTICGDTKYNFKVFLNRVLFTLEFFLSYLVHAIIKVKLGFQSFLSTNIMQSRNCDFPPILDQHPTIHHLYTKIFYKVSNIIIALILFSVLC